MSPSGGSGREGREIERHPSDGWAVLAFTTRQAFEQWLDQQHASQPGLWVKLARKGRPVESISAGEALEVATCFGWVDTKVRRYDDDYYLLRYQPRKAGSHWTAGNRELAERLIAEGRMRSAGLAQVAAAKADGRWAPGTA